MMGLRDFVHNLNTFIISCSLFNCILRVVLLVLKFLSYKHVFEGLQFFVGHTGDLEKIVLNCG